MNPELAAMPNVETYTASTVPAELSAAGLEVLLWEGFVEGPVNKKFQRLTFNVGYELGDVQPQCFLHKPSATFTNGGHHMWFTPSDGTPVIKAPGLLKFHAGLNSQLDQGARAVVEEAIQSIANADWEQTSFANAPARWPN